MDSVTPELYVAPELELYVELLLRVQGSGSGMVKGEGGSSVAEKTLRVRGVIFCLPVGILSPGVPGCYRN